MQSMCKAVVFLIKKSLYIYIYVYIQPRLKRTNITFISLFHLKSDHMSILERVSQWVSE